MRFNFIERFKFDFRRNAKKGGEKFTHKHRRSHLHYQPSLWSDRIQWWLVRLALPRICMYSSYLKKRNDTFELVKWTMIVSLKRIHTFYFFHIIKQTWYIFWRKPWTIEFAFLTRCALVCKCTRSIWCCRTGYFIFRFKCILRLQ